MYEVYSLQDLQQEYCFPHRSLNDERGHLSREDPSNGNNHQLNRERESFLPGGIARRLSGQRHPGLPVHLGLPVHPGLPVPRMPQKRTRTNHADETLRPAAAMLLQRGTEKLVL